jgi:sugar/nucleoside kinase (ribokinase family)
MFISSCACCVYPEQASRKKIPILVDTEKKRDGLDDLLPFADYVVCPENFPQTWTEVSSTPGALVSMLLRLPKLKFVIVTSGEHGCLMVQRASKGTKPKTLSLSLGFKTST